MALNLQSGSGPNVSDNPPAPAKAATLLKKLDKPVMQMKSILAMG